MTKPEPTKSSSKPNAKSRKWTHDEVLEAIAFIDKERPWFWEAWDAPPKGTLENPDDEQSELPLYYGGMLNKLHPECEFREITELMGAIDGFRRALNTR